MIAMMNETFYPPRPARSQGLKGISFVTLAGLTLAVLALASSMLSALNMRYEVTPEALRIRSGFSTREIPLDEVTGVWRPEALTGGVRKFGTSVPNLRTGRWRFNETGDITLYATRLETLVVVDTADGRYGVTPENPDAFTDALRSRLPAGFSPAGGSGTAAASMLIPLLLVAVAVPTTLYAVGLPSRFPQTLRYELGPDGLTIRTGFRPVQVRYADVERVEVASPKGYPIRIYGTAVGSLLWGKFRWPDAGPNLYLYCTRMKPLVLLRLRDDRTIGITPEEDERFVAELRKRMG
ncbi:hypothetical protein STH2645 [Symbiobacterium thermophilum IAM 14863]|uniref:Bacterial Pleckstrin homology domain-containing protein n=2 Tax=Symbiobacterium thermophilum TaxID=2734 RepID=Q67L16_SYMTH|nr:hypothetical protein STH2645 [Symbiobacterium thermophilum IAM 14863]